MVTLTRKAFLTLLSMGGTGLFILPFGFRVRAGRGAVVTVGTGSQYDPLLADLIDALGEARPRIVPGDRVVLKPTMAWPRRAAQAANTNPQVVRALARLCLEAGAREIVVFDRTSTSPALCYVASGIPQALGDLKTHRIKVIPLTDRDFVPFRAVPGWLICRYLLEADHLLNVPVAKHHCVRGLSLAMSNLLGAVSPGPLAPPWDGHEAIVRVARAISPALNLLDATRVLVRNGPQGRGLRDVREMRTIAASQDIVALDAYGCTLFGRTPQELRYLQLATAEGLGKADLRTVRIVSRRERV
jgi:uncharacterized protein (DUF362 family)